MKARVTQITLMKEAEDATLFDLGNFILSIKDDGGGEFVTVQELCDADAPEIGIEPDDWPELRGAIDEIMEGVLRSGELAEETK